MKIISLNPDTWQAGRGYRKNRLLSASELKQPGALLQLVSVPPGSSIPPHAHHTSIEVYVVTRGECVLEVDGRTSVMRPGDIILMEPGDVHALANRGEEPFELLVFKTNATEGDVVWDSKSGPLSAPEG
ncbi:MAG: cupin domain-containing protein [Chloroflexota bacterium]|jgi:quercetin dioxygenase-like cupin family protein